MELGRLRRVERGGVCNGAGPPRYKEATRVARGGGGRFFKARATARYQHAAALTALKSPLPNLE